MAEIDNKVCSIDDLQEASRIFEEEFKRVLDDNAPIKTYQHHKNYNPHLSEATKLLIKDRNTLQEQARNSNDPIIHMRAKERAKEVKMAVRKDKREG